MIRSTAGRTGLAQRTRLLVWGMIAALLLVPAVAMQFTAEVNWGAEDFLAAAVLLGGGGLVLEVAARLLADPRKRALATLVILGSLLVLWAELAVGILD